MNPRCLPTFLLVLMSVSALGFDPELTPVWLEGHWCQQSGEELIEEIWLPALAGETLGAGRTSKHGKMTGFEYMRIVNIDGKVSLAAQPGGAPAVFFTITDNGDNWILFENTEHDFPQRVEYRRNGEYLDAEVSGPGSDGKRMAIRFHYTQCE